MAEKVLTRKQCRKGKSRTKLTHLLANVFLLGSLQVRPRKKLDYRMLIETYNGSSRPKNPISPVRSACPCDRSDAPPKREHWVVLKYANLSAFIVAWRNVSEEREETANSFRKPKFYGFDTHKKFLISSEFSICRQTNPSAKRFVTYFDWSFGFTSEF